MSLYQVDKLLFALCNDLELQENYKQNPAEVLKRYDLQDSELEALRDLDGNPIFANVELVAGILFDALEMAVVDEFRQLQAAQSRIGVRH